MFTSFFPKPKLFFSSVVVWSLLAIAFWYWKGADIGAMLGMPQLDPNAPPVIGLSTFWAPDFLWFYIYFAVAAGLFAAFWFNYAPHPMQYWSVIGSAVILFVTYFQVQVSVAINNWYGPFWDMIQAAVGKTRVVSEWDIYRELGVFSMIAIVAVGISVITRFYVAHYIFRWRSAMNDYYMANWSKLRHVEGASQRVQEDTMRFASTTEALGVNLIDSVMTLIAFTPVLIRLSANVSELPVIGAIPHPLLVAAVAWSLFGTLFIALVGIKLPGLEFRNQRVEAAYRKELVYGEDHADRAGPATVRELFSNIRNNYFRLYFHYTYFNFARSFYMQVNNVFSIVILVPSIAAGKISLGALNQISGAFGQVTSSFQYLVSSWSTIIELISIYKRLRAFEAVIEGEPLPAIDQAFIAAGGVEEVAADK